MAATPKSGVLMFLGLKTGVTYQKSVYNPDVANGLIRIDNGTGTPTGTTTGTDFITFDEPVRLFDAAFVTGIVDTVNLRVLANYNNTPFSVNWAAHVNSLATRPQLNIQFNAGTRISFVSTA